MKFLISAINNENYNEILEDNIKDIEKVSLGDNTHDINMNILFSSFSCVNGMVPSISYNKYVKRIVKYGRLDKNVIILANLYIKHVIQLYPFLVITDNNKHRLIATAIILGLIHLDDDIMTYSQYARVVGLSSEELSKLMLNFLILIDFRLGMFDSKFKN